ncbi:hypothetical protein PMG11_09886 [Penicillium brasilianum]|uniref:Zn(2)-C6 fungal-type domain-containing protein n=1 Tax=Penicillium brasilianum TaxID=104259 RepID=A0A0F7TZH4_PENBI|nr:hypothetical protein PMG11_09886 [Penicillium brasilianum]
MSDASHSEADKVLRAKARAHESHACYPCRKRKVKCDGSKPCTTCQKRKHPQICQYDFSGGSPRRSAASAARKTPPRSTSSPSTRARDTVTNEVLSRQDGGSNNYVYSGGNSFVSILGLQASNANDSVARELGSVLGLQNTLSSYPFMDPKTKDEKWETLLAVLPQRTEVLKFFHYYQVTAYPFNPIVADMGKFESEVCAYLNAHATGEFCDPKKISDSWITDKSVGHISLLLATLAAGAHFSDMEYPQRLKITIDFARRSFDCLRLANFLFQPSLDIIQALLILGNTMQNMGQSDAAWALLGTTVRLAQTMGLHTERSTVHWPEYVQTKARALWSAIVWQDSLLCLCYDRPPMVSVMEWPLENSFLERQDLSYTEVMHLICRLGLEIMRPNSLGVAEVQRAIDDLQRLDNIGQHGLSYLRAREKCATLQQHLEHLAWKMHTSFCVSVICRPAMRRSPPQPVLPENDILRARAKASLVDASKSFLNFQALSIVPLRSWSMVHTVLSSTLLLCIWEETRNDPECRSLQQRVIDVFSSSDSRNSEDSGSFMDEDNQWLSARHIRALVTLRSVLDREGGTANLTNDERVVFNINNTMPQLENWPESHLDMLNPLDISPVAYLDSIMNVPLFDFSSEDCFL